MLFFGLHRCRRHSREWRLFYLLESEALTITGEKIYQELERIATELKSLPIATFTAETSPTSTLYQLVLFQSTVNYQTLFARCGLSLETLKHFGYGFLDNWTAPKSRLDNKKISPSRRLIIPISEHHYLASTIDRNKVDKQWWKMHAGSKEIFNAANVTANSSTVKRTRNALFDTPNGGNVISSVKAAETNPNNKS